MLKTKIEWCDYSSNPIKAVNIETATKKRGWFCTKVSKGCAGCYSEAINKRFGNGLPYTAANESKIDFVLDENELDKIAKSRAPAGSRVFLCDMTDLFHWKIPIHFIDAVFATIATRPDLTFIILTKRPAEMIRYFYWNKIGDILCRLRDEYGALPSGATAPEWLKKFVGLYQLDDVFNGTRKGLLGYREPTDKRPRKMPEHWPLPNLQLGVSVEDQPTADERIPDLLQCPAAVRIVSYEPALGPLGLDYHTEIGECDSDGNWLDQIDGVIAGGESGQGARPSHPDWFRAVRNECQALEVPFFFKQWGEWYPLPEPFKYRPNIGSGNAEYNRALKAFCRAYGASMIVDARPEGWEGHLSKYSALSDGEYAIGRVGKKKAGRLLDGVEHNELPDPRTENLDTNFQK